MITFTPMQRTQFATFAAALLTMASIAQAAPANIKTKSVRVHEIHREADTSRQARPIWNAPAATAAFPVRSHAELEMINPG